MDDDQKRTWLTYLALPFTLLLGIVYFLVGKNKGLETELKNQKINNVISGTLSQGKEAEHVAKQKETDYQSVRDEYLKQHSGEGGNDV